MAARRVQWMCSITRITHLQLSSATGNRRPGTNGYTDKHGEATGRNARAGPTAWQMAISDVITFRILHRRLIAAPVTFEHAPSDRICKGNTGGGCGHATACDHALVNRAGLATSEIRAF